MSATEIIRQIKHFSVGKRILIVKRIMKTIGENDSNRKMQKAVDALLNDYKTDRNLTAFTALDFANFYEAR